MTSRPAYSPCEPALGWSETAAKPVISASHFSRSAEEALVALRLVGGREGMHAAELRPGDRDHLAGRVELHRAGAERDHGVREREIAATRSLKM